MKGNGSSVVVLSLQHSGFLLQSASRERCLDKYYSSWLGSNKFDLSMMSHTKQPSTQSICASSQIQVARNLDECQSDMLLLLWLHRVIAHTASAPRFFAAATMRPMGSLTLACSWTSSHCARCLVRACAAVIHGSALVPKSPGFRHYESS